MYFAKKSIPKVESGCQGIDLGNLSLCIDLIV